MRAAAGSSGSAGRRGAGRNVMETAVLTNPVAITDKQKWFRTDWAPSQIGCKSVGYGVPTLLSAFNSRSILGQQSASDELKLLVQGHSGIEKGRRSGRTCIRNSRPPRGGRKRTGSTPLHPVTVARSRRRLKGSRAYWEIMSTISSTWVPAEGAGGFLLNPKFCFC